MKDNFRFLSHDETFMIVNQTDIEKILLLIQSNREFLYEIVSDCKNPYQLILLSEWDQIFSIFKDLVSAVNPNPNVFDQIAFFVIKLNQLSINMAFLKTGNGSLFNDCS